MGTRKAYKRCSRCHRGRHRSPRPKTFSSEEKAKAYAQKQGMKNFEVVRLKSGLSRKVKITEK
ncbi:TPA: hypothetical protein HA219_02490 [Candidatus Woesearchaeota archaeon]|nr:hypothetical protein [Candidatus Woesearchaeota archaeon]HIH39561.1 hypothetical protein [Candidatus Woesearchaeota archaeon]